MKSLRTVLIIYDDDTKIVTIAYRQNDIDQMVRFYPQGLSREVASCVEDWLYRQELPR